MSRARFEKRCAAVPARVIERAVLFLRLQGYELEARAEGQASLWYSGGLALATQLDRTQHHLELVSDGKSLFFEFHSAMGSSGYITKKERRHLEERAEQVVAAARAGEAPPPTENAEASFRCRYCRALTPLEKPSCQSCGADNFV